RGPGRRLARRTCLSAAILGLLGVGAVQAPAAFAATLESVSPNKGCPGETVVFTGKGFGGPKTGTTGWHNEAAGSVPHQFNTLITVTSSTSATGYIPLFLVAAPGEEKGTVQLTKPETNSVPFFFTPLEECFSKGGGGGGEKGATGPTGAQ